MRRKFRAWTGEEMLYNVIPISENEIIEIHPITKDVRIREVKVILVSTGLRDMNGKEIFEDDIIYWDDMKRRYNVYFCRDCARWEANPRTTHYSQVECGRIFRISKVIGNIHENPELFKVGK